MSKTCEEECSDGAVRELVKTVFQSGSVWHVNIFLSSLEDSAREEMVHRLRDAKYMISKQFKVPHEQLELREVISKTEVIDGYEALVSLALIKAEKGKPIVTLKPGVTPNGSVFNDMLAELEFYYFDERDNIITLDRIEAEINAVGVARDMCDLEAIVEAMDKVHKEKKSVKGLPIAGGEFPAEGSDAQLEYTFCPGPTDEQQISDFEEKGKVREGDILCRRIPPGFGDKTGCNVRGTELPILQGLDFILVPGEGSQLAKDGCALIALIDGIAKIEHVAQLVSTPDGERTFPRQVKVTVRPVIKVNAEDVDALVLDDSVEIEGTLKAGSSVTTKGEVYLNGNIEDGAVITAGSSVRINGEINNASVSSHNSVVTSNGVKDSDIIAAANVELGGIAENSRIVGENIAAEEAKGSEIIAAHSVELTRVSSDEKGGVTRIQVGRKDYFGNKIEGCLREINNYESSLSKISEVFQKEAIVQVTLANVQPLLIKHLRDLRRRGDKTQNDGKVKNLRKLLESVVYQKGMIALRKNELKDYQEKSAEKSDQEPTVVIKEKITDPVEITIDGKPTKINQD